MYEFCVYEGNGKQTKLPCTKVEFCLQVHRCVKVKSGKIVVLLKIFLKKAISDCFINLSPIFTIFSILINNVIVDMSYDFGCHGNHFGGNLCVTIVTKLLCY